MIIAVDIDGTLCTTHGTDYAGAQPIPHRIARINALYEAGHTIVLWTARGSGTGVDHHELTRCQMNSWGVMYTELRVGNPGGKIPFDLFIDDRAVNAASYFEGGDW